MSKIIKNYTFSLPTDLLNKLKIAMAHQIRSISKERLRDICGFIEIEDCKGNIKNAIKVYLDLS